MGGLGIHFSALKESGPDSHGRGGKSCRSCTHFVDGGCDQPTRLRYGKPFDPERPCGYHRTRQRLFEQGRRPEGPEAECMGASGLRSRPVLRDDMAWFPSASFAAKQMGASPGYGSQITRCCKGQGRTAMGHRWMYAEDCADGVFRCKWDELHGVGDSKAISDVEGAIPNKDGRNG